MSDKQKILITGGNRGLGYCLAENICKREDNSILVILTARNKAKGRQAVQEIKTKYPDCCIIFYPLDLQCKTSMRNLVDWIHVKLGSIDIVVNNAGQHEGFGVIAEDYIAKSIFDVNLFGVIDLNEQLLPILSQDARILFLTSRLSISSSHDQIVEGILNNPSLSLGEIKAYGYDFIQSLKSKQNQDMWNSSAYVTSKSLMNAYVRHEFSKKLILDQMAFCVCPGWCQTDMGGKNAPLTPLEGIESILFLIFSVSLVDKAIMNGKFIADKSIISF